MVVLPDDVAFSPLVALFVVSFVGDVVLMVGGSPIWILLWKKAIIKINTISFI